MDFQQEILAANRSEKITETALKVGRLLDGFTLAEAQATLQLVDSLFYEHSNFHMDTHKATFVKD